MTVTVRCPVAEVHGARGSVYLVPDLASCDAELRNLDRRLRVPGVSPKLAEWLRSDRDLLLDRRSYLFLCSSS